MSLSGDRIRELRIRHDMTLDDVAKYLGINRQAVYKYEQGIVTNIPLDKIEKMAVLFDTTPDYIAGWSDEEKPLYSPILETMSNQARIISGGVDRMPPEKRVGDSGTSKNGARHYYYTCQAHKARKGCRKKSVRKDWLESFVVDFILDNVLSEEHIEQTADVILRLQEEELQHSPLSAMESEYNETQKKIRNINNAIAAGVWNSSTSAMLKDLEDNAENLRVSIETLRFSQAQLMDKDRILFFLHQFTSGDRSDPLLRRHIIETFVNAVYVYDDHLKLVTNNMEGNQRVPLSDLPPECSDNYDCSVPTVLHPNTRVTIYQIAI